MNFFGSLWFWLGHWVFFYTKIFGNVSGVILADTFMYLLILLLEIPTGAIADMLGKKKTLIIAFFFRIAWAIFTWKF